MDQDRTNEGQPLAEAAADRVRDWPKASIPMPPWLFEAVQEAARACGLNFSEAVRLVLEQQGLAFLRGRASTRMSAKEQAKAVA